MTDPDRAVEEARRHVYGRYRSPWFLLQWLGVVLVFAALVAAIWNKTHGGVHGSAAEIAAIVLLALGLALSGVAFWRRNAYHRRRNSGS